MAPETWKDLELLGSGPTLSLSVASEADSTTRESPTGAAGLRGLRRLGSLVDKVSSGSPFIRVG